MNDNEAAVIEWPPLFTKKTKRKKMTHDWSEDDIFKLIGEVECHPCIWNASSADYHNKPMRDNAWTEIGGMLNISTEEVCTKWSNLRIQYRGYLNKKTKSGQGTDNARKWKYFDSMAFVGRAEVSQRQPTTTNLYVPSESEGKLMRMNSLIVNIVVIGEPFSYRISPIVCALVEQDNDKCHGNIL